MKTTVYFKQFLPALATLVTVGFASSCQDQNFDWDDAHARTQYEKFENVFIKSFGKPQEGHQWGFDAAKIAFNNASSTRTYIKQDEVSEYLYGEHPKDIQTREHNEVYAWFSNHRVTWEENPKAYSTNNTTTRISIDDLARVIGTNTIQGYLDAGYGSLVSVNANYTFNNANGVLGEYKIGPAPIFNHGWVQLVAQNEANEYAYTATPDGRIVYRTSEDHYFVFDGTFVETNEDGTTSGAEFTGNKSDLVFYKVVGDYASIGEVALYKDKEHPAKIYKEGSGNYIEVGKETGLVVVNGLTATKDNVSLNIYKNTSTPTTIKKGQQMDHICCFDLLSSNYEGNHLKDFNGQGGWGWNRQPSTPYGGYGSDRMNAALITNAEIDNWTFKSSIGGGTIVYDKYLLVYLKGGMEKDPDYENKDTRYEGWYLGFDFESYGTTTENRLFADGICNDYILKLTAASNVAYSDVRIMCEDLGGVLNNANKSDIDYNDIVLDISTKTINWAPVTTLTLQAAGGTLPLTVWYDDKPLFETHAFFANGTPIYSFGQYQNEYNSNYSKASVDYSIMYRTGESNGEASPRKYIIYKSNISNTNDGADARLVINNDFDLDKLKIKVYRFDADDYKDSDGIVMNSTAEWVNLDNTMTGVPVMFCVPNTVQWLLERHAIDSAYPSFSEWVRNSNIPFWGTGKTVNSSHLY